MSMVRSRSSSGSTESPRICKARNFWRRVIFNPWIGSAIVGYAAEAICWMYVLGHTPLSVVGPMAALAYVGTVLAGKLFLGEHASRQRWAGAALVTLGAALLGASLG